MQNSASQQAIKRQPNHRIGQPNFKSTPKKKIKKLKQNPFDDLPINYNDDDQMQNGQKQRSSDKANSENQWVKVKTTPLTISVVDHSRTNKYYSHKSLQKYIKYLFVKNCPNPLWLSIKRQSQVEHIIFIDIQIQNNLFYKYMLRKQQSGENEKESKEKQQDIFRFIPKFNKPENKAIFKQTRFLKQSTQVWDALLVYDHEAVKQQASNLSTNLADLPAQLTQDIFKYYQTYLLTEQQRKYNLYPMPQLPAYKQYYRVGNQQHQQKNGHSNQSQKDSQIIKQTGKIQLKQINPSNQELLKIEEKSSISLKNKILVIDCEMVMGGINFLLARTSIMNFQGELIYDQLFKPSETITNYNTQFSGITEQTLRNVTKNIKDLHHDLSKLVTKDTILVGHSLENDLHAMKFIHNRVIDTSVLYSRKNGSKMKLKTLAYQILNRSIQVGSHCSEEDCLATLQLMRQKIQACRQTPSPENKTYHLLNELQQSNRKIVMIDNNLEFIKHRKEYIGIQFQQVENQPINKDIKEVIGEQQPLNKSSYISKFMKYFDKNVKNPDLILSMIRKCSNQQWQDYYRRIDLDVEALYKGAPDKTVFFLNFQVNNFYQIYPQIDSPTLVERRRPFCLFVVKSQ